MDDFPDVAETTGFYKWPVSGPVRVGRLNLEGDGQADLRHHGGVDKAILAYSADHYAAWRTDIEGWRPEPGAFGENLSIAGQTEQDVCIGDVWRLGDCLLEVSQPRQPCWKIGRRWNIKTLPKQVLQTGRTGWYLRVAREGVIAAGLPMQLEQRPHADWSIARAHRTMFAKLGDADARLELAGLKELAGSWKLELSP